MNDAVLHFTLVEHQDHQHAKTRQWQELDVPEGSLIGTGYRDQTGLMGDPRQQVRGCRDQLGGGLVRVELVTDILDIFIVQRLHGHQRIDEKTISPRGGHPSG